MQWKLHVRFGGRAGETHQLKSRKGAPVRPLHLCSDLVGLRVRSVGNRRVLSVYRRLACLGVAAYRPGSRRSRTSNLGPPTGHSRPRPAAGSSLRRRQPIPVHPLHQPAGGSRHLTVGRISRRFLRQRPRRICHRPLQDRTHPTEGTVEGPGPSRVRHPRVRRLVQPPPTPRTNREHPTSREGGQLPSSTKASPASWTQVKHSPANPVRFTPVGWWCWVWWGRLGGLGWVFWVGGGGGRVLWGRRPGFLGF